MEQNPRQAIVVYGDFNCPFCFALHEHLFAHNCLDKVEWRLIQHAPEIDSQSCSPEEQVELASEVATVRHRAPEISIALPPGRPNTRPANIITASLGMSDSVDSQRFRQLVYQALWLEGLDISSPEVLQQLLLQVSGQPVPTQNQIAIEKLQHWQRSWEEGNYQQRIPIIQHPVSQPLIGLSSISDVLSYLDGTEQQQSHEIATCAFKPRPIILLLGSLPTYWPQLQPLQTDFDIRILASHEEFSAFINGPEQADLLLLTGAPDEPGNQHCLQLILQRTMHQLSAIKLGTEYNPAEELLSYQLGYSDYLYPALPAAIITARIKRLVSLKRLADQLQQQSNRDHLTQLYNRREFEHNLELEWLRATRAKRPLSLLMIDIDYFKRYNDAHGHLAGDDCLRAIAKVIEQSINRPADRAFRYGGEEFTLLLPETNIQGASVVASRLQRLLSRHNLESPGNDSPGITLSIGIATSGIISRQTPHDLLILADQNLLQAKRAGRNQIIKATLL